MGRCGQQLHSLGVSVSDRGWRKEKSREGKISQNPAAEETEARRYVMTNLRSCTVCCGAEDEPKEVETLNSVVFYGHLLEYI